MEHTTRLRKLKEREQEKIIKTASFQIPLEFINLESGDVIDFSVRTVNNKPWYSLKHEHSWETSSFYDGSDFERACNIYKELLMSFTSISSAEEFVKSIPSLANRINKYYEIAPSSKFQEYHSLIQKNPLFLGMNDF